jgi:NodT family efflux transporter outer membrane factor (OMF) lipoprotein
MQRIVDGVVRARRGVLLGVLLTAAACPIGPRFKKPEVPLNVQWSEHRDPRLAAKLIVDRAWWQTFNDPVLDRVVDLAYHQNLSLQIAGLRILEARARLGVAFWNQFPQIGAGIASASAVGVSEHAANAANVDHHFGDYLLGFDALWEIDFWRKYRRGVRAEKALYLATVADYDNAIVSLTAEVARTYALIRTQEVLIQLAEENIALQQEGLGVAESRFRNGATSELDVTQAATLLETTRASLPEQRLALQQAQNALCTLLGRATGCAPAILAGGSGIPVAPQQVAVSVPAEMLRRRADIRGAELRAVAQCDRIGIAKADLFPRFTLFGSIGTQTSSGGGAASGNSSITDLFGPASLFFTAGLRVFWPILSYGRIMNNVRVEDARFQQALVDYQNAVLNAAREVEDGIAGFLREQDAVVFAQYAVTNAQASVRLAVVQYREGSIDYQRVLDSERTLVQAQNNLVRARSLVATNLIAVYKALGGGWELRDGQPIVPDHIRDEMKQRTNWGNYLSPPPPPKKANGHTPTSR